MPIKRKTASYLNHLRLDLKSCLDSIGQIGEHLDASCQDLSKIHPHDVRTDDAGVKIRFDQVLDDYEELKKLLKQFRISRSRYLEFF